jgi:two-component system heavy metal sensor histidine kinase CusS
LVLGLVLGTTSLLALNGYGIYAGVKRRLYNEFDGLLVEVLKSNLSAITRSVRPRTDPLRPAPAPFPELVERSEFALQVWIPSGRTAVKSEHLGEHSLPRLASDLEALSYDNIEVGALHFEALRLPDGSQGRALALYFSPPPPPTGRPPGAEAGQPGYELVLAQSTERLRETLAALSRLLVIAWATSSAGCAAILTWIVSRGLRPLGQLRQRIQTLDAEVLGQQIDLAQAPAELEPVVEQFNGLLARLHAAFDRERAFTSDAAHELRTPLSGLRSTLEVFLSRERDAVQAQEAAENCLAITLEMQALVETLLEMASAEGGNTNDELSVVDLDVLVRRNWERLDADVSGDHALTLDVDGDLQLTAAPSLLDRILSNLLQNARAHGDEGHPIEVSAHRQDGHVIISVTNQASEAPSNVAEHAFEAFWRADTARTAIGRHAGLGLPLCRRLATRMGASLEAHYTYGRFTTTLTLREGDNPDRA